MLRPSTFVWENLGPTHEDRLAALAARFPDRVSAIELTPTSHTYEWDGRRGHAVPSRTLFERPDQTNGLRCTFAIVKAVRQLGARDVYMCDYQRWPVLIATILLRLLGRRVFTLIDSKFDDYTRDLRREIVKSFYLMPYNGALTASDRSREYLKFLGFHNRPIALGYDTLSVERIRRQASGPPAPDGAPHAGRHFLVIARLVTKKNIACAIRAYALWRAQGGAGRELRILGSGELEQELRTLAEELGVADGVIFEGFVQTERVSEALSGALCMLLPSWEEQFGLVVIEAMAMGVPVLASSNAGAVDVMIDNGVNGWIVDPRSPVALARAMERLDRDESEWRAMAAAARDDSMRGDASVFADSVAALSSGPQAAVHSAGSSGELETRR